jgi:hypothetical protein
VGVVKTFTVSLRATGLMRRGEHAIKLAARIPADSPEEAVESMVGLLSDTGSFLVMDDTDGFTVVIDRDFQESPL